MRHISANLAFGRHEKIFMAKKVNSTFFFPFFFFDTKVLVGAANKSTGGAIWQRYALPSRCRPNIDRTHTNSPYAYELIGKIILKKYVTVFP